MAPKEVEKIVTGARDILIVPESIRTHDKVRVRNTMMAERIEALVVLENQHVDSLNGYVSKRDSLLFVSTRSQGDSCITRVLPPKNCDSVDWDIT
jgi:hypothetical protein